MDYFLMALSYLINGLMIGCLYALMSIGLALILGVLKIVNFAHGEFYMWSAYISYAVSHFLGFNPFLSFVIASIFSFLLGIFVEKLLITPLYTGKTVEHYDLLITFGLSIFLMNLAVVVFGPYQVAAPPMASGYVKIGPLNVSSGRLLVATIAVILMIILLLIIKNTTVGISLRATAQDREASSVMGINVNRISTIGFGIGAMLAGITGALLGPVFIVYPMMGQVPDIKAFVILILGGMGSIKGTLIAAIMLGILENMGVLFLSPSYRDAYGFILLIIVLIIKPTGLFGGETL